ncbi:hypothetical protein E0H68_33170 [Rhizobium leguminosarum bv. viciae]|nr:hypothetical protein E0H44_29760 [Rhizobium leguminosarum bv. viciae]TCA04889.1 hypothetical protein E0H68_33170 [Rhizobium leguminosarum bv. viciae]TCA16659.1 hypothetical protein E0H67_32505 [Rhizobium leguminosarum bv. viciae]
MQRAASGRGSGRSKASARTENQASCEPPVRNRYSSARAFPFFFRITEVLYLFVFMQFRTQNRCALLLELLYEISE